MKTFSFLLATPCLLLLLSTCNARSSSSSRREQAENEAVEQQTNIIRQEEAEPPTNDENALEQKTLLPVTEAAAAAAPASQLLDNDQFLLYNNHKHTDVDGVQYGAVKIENKVGKWVKESSTNTNDKTSGAPTAAVAVEEPPASSASASSSSSSANDDVAKELADFNQADESTATTAFDNGRGGDDAEQPQSASSTENSKNPQLRRHGTRNHRQHHHHHHRHQQKNSPHKIPAAPSTDSDVWPGEGSSNDQQKDDTASMLMSDASNLNSRIVLLNNNNNNVGAGGDSAEPLPNFNEMGDGGGGDNTQLINSNILQQQPQLPPIDSVAPTSPPEIAETLPSQRPPQTLEEIYSKLLRHRDDTTHATLLYLKFAQDLQRWNPNNRTSEWQWVYKDTQYAADHAYLDTRRTSDDNTAVATLKGITLISSPFDRYRPNSDELAYTTYYEGAVEPKDATLFSVNAQQRILFRLKYNCKIFHVDQHPFPAALVTDAWDDPRLANCQFQVYEPNGGLFFYFSVTNKAIWAVYGSTNGLRFVAKRRVALRQTSSDMIDGALEYDGLHNSMSYYVNGQKVWSLHALGAPPPNDGITRIDMGQGDVQIFHPTLFNIAFGTQKCLDEADPNAVGVSSVNNAVRLVRVSGNPASYANGTRFFDDKSLRQYNLWGQSAKMTLYKLLVVRADSAALLAASHEDDENNNAAVVTD